MTAAADDKPSIDVRLISPPERHPLIFRMLNSLLLGNAMLLTSDHDPVPLRRHMETQFSAVFGWNYLECGPDVWRVEIERLAHEGCTCCSGS